MTKTALLAALAGAALLAACEPMPTEPAPPAPPADECGAAGYQGLIGQRREVLGQMTFPMNTRVIGPDDAVTADFRPERLNIEYGRNGRIERVSCY
ncbi:I78 family peptidase inhibitor [Paracoccus tibetensis]|uniref:Peptidase inhibitor I78 family protein n=1 Tax=Paracoccus tibetensis TaxID=336292 RepID=A0A1G5IST0_9RHOB|nr:I78 family peptidase inhibitor [Paracoccus tibetensis]SCY79175.1 Peptidase inhibitor I78 family protein [Paracoccus tibetensis]